MNGWSYYQTENLALIPYMEGTPVWKDGLLSTLYFITKEEGKIEPTFCGDVLNHDEFVSFFHKRKTMQVLCEVENNKDLNVVGYSWVDLPRGVDGERAVMCGFCFFRGASRRTSARDLAKLGLAYWFMDMKIDVVHGVMLESNIRGRNFSQVMGFKEVALIPKYHFHNGHLESARVMILEKQDFVPGFEQWFSQQKAVAGPEQTR